MLLLQFEQEPDNAVCALVRLLPCGQMIVKQMKPFDWAEELVNITMCKSIQLTKRAGWSWTKEMCEKWKHAQRTPW